MLVKSLAAPGKYFQGNGILEELYSYISFAGSKFLVLSDEIVLRLIGDKLKKGFEGTDGEYEIAVFGGESTLAEARCIADVVKKKGYQGIIGAGGGKVIDTAKYVSNQAGVPVIIIPTSASSDAPCSAMSVVYEEDGSFVESCRMKHNPDVVFVDTGIIAAAPVRLLRAGLGDAFATWYEARACKESGADNFTGGKRSEAAYTIAKLCNEILLKYAGDALDAVEKKQWSDAVDMIVEANIYLSGVGFENNGCAIAHAFYSGMTEVIHPLPVMHGEAVAVGTLVQLELEYMHSGKRNEKEWKEVIGFYNSVGLPKTFRELGLEIMDDETVDALSSAVCKLPNAKKMPFDVTPELLKKAVMRVNK